MFGVEWKGGVGIAGVEDGTKFVRVRFRGNEVGASGRESSGSDAV
jgi:hypothetical protein